MFPPVLLVLLFAAVCFLAALLDYQPSRAVPLGLFFLTLYFMFGGVR